MGLAGFSDFNLHIRSYGLSTIATLRWLFKELAAFEDVHSSDRRGVDLSNGEVVSRRSCCFHGCPPPPHRRRVDVCNGEMVFQRLAASGDVLLHRMNGVFFVMVR